MKRFFLFAALIVTLSALAQQAGPKTDNCKTPFGSTRMAVLDELFKPDSRQFEEISTKIRLSTDRGFDVYQIYIVESGGAVAIAYHIEGNKYLGRLIADALAAEPCATPSEIARSLPITKKITKDDPKLNALVNDFFKLRFQPRRHGNVFIFDALVFEIEVIGEDHIRFTSVHRDTPPVVWAESVMEHLRTQN